MNHIAEDILMHYGVKRRSGRYPWGSGDNAYQHSGDFLSRVQELKKQGLSEKAIVESMGLDSTTQLRVAYSIAKNERRSLDVDRARSLTTDGKTPTEIGKIMGINESSVRSLLNESSAKRMSQAENIANSLKKELENKKIIDVGDGVERQLGVSRTKMEEAIYMMEAEGYKRYGIGMPQVTNVGKQTNMQVLCQPDIEYGYVYKNPGEIKEVGSFTSDDGGITMRALQRPASLSSDRVAIRYAEEGGLAKDGVIELRRGVADLDLGKSTYAQVRIMVDGTHYLKGMAVYSDDMPAGKDIVFNTNKHLGTDKMKVLKAISDDPDNPFKANIKANGQSEYIGADGKKHLSPINKLKEEGDWDKMSKNLSSQFLSKQPMDLIKKQLKLTYADSEAEFDEIMKCTNPVVKKKLLLDFADTCDGAVAHLKSAALPRQSTKVLLPLTCVKDDECYCPTYQNGEKLALVRYPHGGTFEIPIVTVNNKVTKAKQALGNITDAIGISSKVAERLSGADFDGDQVIAIPTNGKVKIKSTSMLEDLKGFDPKEKYPYKEGMRVMSEDYKQKQMGIVSNLITDMTLRGATEKELARAVKHSMVVIDAAKHKLNYKQSEKDNGIAELKVKYQGHEAEGETKLGASTLLSRRKQEIAVPERRGSGTIDPETGKVSYKESGRTYTNKKGETKVATTKVKLLNEVDDLHTLSSGTPQENAYADYGNKMKALSNKARKAYLSTEHLKYSAEAKQTYKEEVASLNAKLNVAAMNAPRERRAQAIANSVLKAKKQDNPELANDKKELKKIANIEINKARNLVGARSKETKIQLTDREWEAIQSGAISENNLSKILRYTDSDAVKKRAMPKQVSTLSKAQINKAKAMANTGYTIAEIAKALGKSTSTVSNYINE